VIDVMADTDRMRAYVSNLYSGPNWKQKVARMPDNQVTAIYLKHERDGEASESEDVEVSPDQTNFDSSPTRGQGPHADEDDFPFY